MADEGQDVTVVGEMCRRCCRRRTGGDVAGIGIGDRGGVWVEVGREASSNFGPGNLNFLHCQRPGTSNFPLDRPDEAAWLPERRMDILPPPHSLSFQFGTSQLKLCRPNRRSSSPSPSPSPTKQTLGPHFHVSPPGPDLHGPPWRITSPVRHHSTANQHPSRVLTGPPLPSPRPRRWFQV